MLADASLATQLQYSILCAVCGCSVGGVCGEVTGVGGEVAGAIVGCDGKQALDVLISTFKLQLSLIWNW